jgi:hypothetical protein
MKRGIPVTFSTCRKEHGKCDICLQPIKPGEKYIRVVIPPWESEIEFVFNDFGQIINSWYINSHKWEVHETHEKCEKWRAEEMREAEMDLEWETPLEYDY